MALRSNTGISRGISEEDGVEEAGLDWAEQSVAIINKETQRMGVRISASRYGVCCDLPVPRCPASRSQYGDHEINGGKSPTRHTRPKRPTVSSLGATILERF